jgi:nucleoside-diphosphate-sugar epimerase
MITVLVTGAAGMIGSTLCPALLAAGHKVLAIDSLRYGQVTALAACCADPNFQFDLIDVRDWADVGLALRRADVIVPLAALVGAPICSRHVEEAVAVNRYAIEWLVKRVRPDQLIVFPNSNSAYGSMPEGQEKPLDEDSPQTPLSLYAETKCTAERAVLEHPNSVVFRLATLFGASPRHRSDLLVNTFVLKAFQERSVVLFDPHARRNYVHVRDVADAFVWAISSWEEHTIYGGDKFPAEHRVFNLGHDGSNCTKLELCERIKLQVPDFEWHGGAGSDPDRRDYLVSSARLAAAGFEAKRSLDDGIRELIQLYRGFPLMAYGNI